MGSAEIFDLLGAQTAGLAGQGDDLVAGGLHGAGLVAGDVAGGGGNDALVMPERCGNDGGVGLGAAHQEVHGDILPAAEGFHPRPGTLGAGVLRVAGILGVVVQSDGLEDFGDTAFGIVAFKAKHGQ